MCLLPVNVSLAFIPSFLAFPPPSLSHLPCAQHLFLPSIVPSFYPPLLCFPPLLCLFIQFSPPFFSFLLFLFYSGRTFFPCLPPLIHCSGFPPSLSISYLFFFFFVTRIFVSFSLPILPFYLSFPFLSLLYSSLSSPHRLPFHLVLIYLSPAFYASLPPAFLLYVHP